MEWGKCTTKTDKQWTFECILPLSLDTYIAVVTPLGQSNQLDRTDGITAQTSTSFTYKCWFTQSIGANFIVVGY